MTEAGAQKAVLASVLVVGGGMVWESRKSGKVGLKQLFALVAVGAVLAGLAGAVPDVAGWLAVLIAVSYLIART